MATTKTAAPATDIDAKATTKPAAATAPKAAAKAAPKAAAKAAPVTPAPTAGTVATEFFNVDPRTIRVVEGFNPRKPKHPHVEVLTQVYKDGKPLPPLVVARGDDGVWELVDGEHRMLAAIASEKLSIPAFEFFGTMQERLAYAIASSQGMQLTPEERAIGNLRLRNDGWTDKEIAGMTGRSEGDVANHLLLAQCGPEVLAKVADGTIKATPIFKLAREIGPEKVWDKLKTVMDAKAAEVAEEEALAASTPESTQKGQGAAQTKGRRKAMARGKPGAKDKTAATKSTGRVKAKITEADLLTSFGKKEAMRVSELATYFTLAGTSIVEGKEVHTYSVPAEVSTELAALVKCYLAGHPAATA